MSTAETKRRSRRPAQQADVPAPRPPDTAETAASAAPPRSSRTSRTRAVAVAIGLAVVGAAGAVTLLQDGGVHLPGASNGDSLLPPTAAITLPASVAGLGGAPRNDPTQAADWKQHAKVYVHDATIAGRTYGDGTPSGRSIRVVAARADLTGALELDWAADPGQAVGEVRCTNNTRLTPQSKPKVRPTLMLCWRTSQTLSVYALEIDPRATTPVGTAAAAAAVESVWQSARQG